MQMKEKREPHEIEGMELTLRKDGKSWKILGISGFGITIWDEFIRSSLYPFIAWSLF